MRKRVLQSQRNVLLALGVLLLAALGCGLFDATPTSPATEQPAAEFTAVPTTPAATVEATAPAASATPTVEHFVTPGAPSTAERFLNDVDASTTAAEGRVVGGENFTRNRLERPFTQGDMSYRPDLDINRAEISLDETWAYFTIEVQGPAQNGNSYPGTYSVELDLDQDGRGDLLIMAREPSAAWSAQGVSIWADENDDVGGEVPFDADESPGEGDGYETNLFDGGRGEDPDAAWSRIAAEASGVQIAVKRSVIGDLAFLWGVWAQAGAGDPSTFDYVDRLTHAEAGSPLADSEHYPLQSLAEVDNTCRMYYGFSPTGNEPGICLVFGTVQNCTFHPIRMEPGGVVIPMVQESGSVKDDVAPGTYSFYDLTVQDNGENALVLTAEVRPGTTVQIVTDGNDNTWECP